MRILFVGNFVFPVGSAAASRIHKYGLGVIRAGGEAFVVATSPPETPVRSHTWAETETGVRYAVLPDLDRSRPLYSRVFHVPAFYDRLRKHVLRHTEELLRKSQVDAVVGYGQSAYVLDPLVRLCRHVGVPCILEVNEWQASDRFRGGILSPIYWDRQLFRVSTLRKASAAIAISTLWEDYATSMGRPVIRIPALGDGSPPSGVLAPPRVGLPFIITYLGHCNPRDLPLTMLEGFRMALSDGLQAKLVMVGDVNHGPLGKRVVARVRNDPLLASCVEFTGHVSETEVRARLSEANALVLLRPDTWETRACFPTRIPEYLITGNPVVLSNVGDVSLYLKDRENAILLPSGDRPYAFHEAIRYLSSMPERARDIGQAGCKTALQEFSIEKHGKLLLDFARQLHATYSLRRGQKREL